MLKERPCYLLLTVCLSVHILLFSSPSFGYSIWEYCSGRADYANRYDLTGVMWPDHAGDPIYNFGYIGKFEQNPPGVDDSWLTNAVVSASNEWEKWANVQFADGLGRRVRGMFG